MRYGFLMPILLLLAGCETMPPGWTHPTKGAAEWKLDAAECARVAGSDELQPDTS